MEGKEKAKVALKHLIDYTYLKYKDNKDFSHNESQVRRSLIEPFVQNVLGWDISDPSEVRVESPVSGKRSDILVCANGITQFVIEAKALSQDIVDDNDYYRQAISYAHSKEKTFAILTNFRHWIILRCDVEVDNPLKAAVKTINIENVRDEELEILLCFSKKIWIEKGDTNPIFQQFANFKRRIKVDVQLLKDLTEWRQAIINNILQHPRHNKFDFSDEKIKYEVEENIQRYIDRLIFVCYAEDKEFEDSQLKSLIDLKKDKHFESSSWLLEKIRGIFKEYLSKYNSDLFTQGKSDEFYIDDGILLKILTDLRKPKDRLPYDFGSIEADILGKTYENFLGHIISGEKRLKEKESKGKRKEMGIYYTPTYIVDYIVRNTVGEYIKGKPISAIMKVKVLDPACGSGSFLIKAFDVLVEECEKTRKLNYEEKKNLMLNCIHGVDLDERAVDICKLNLSLKLAARGQKLPQLHDNIKCGNSLIDDKEIAGFKAFKWEDEFKDIMSNGGFDCVIGNPPYGADFNEIETNEILRIFSVNQGELESFKIFFERGYNLLRYKGKLGFIVPNTWMYISRSSKTREFLLRKTKLIEILELAKYVFLDAPDMVPAIIILEKDSKNEDNVCQVRAIPLKGKELDFLNKNWRIDSKIDQKTWLKNVDLIISITLNKKNLLILEKIKTNNLPLKAYATVKYGIKTGDNDKYIDSEKKSDTYVKCLFGRNIGRYTINWKNSYLKYGKWLEGFREEKVEIQKILIQYTRKLSLLRRIVATLDTNQEYYPLNSLSYVYSSSDISNFVLLGILNSKLMNFYFSNTFIDIGIKPVYLVQLPIKKISNSNNIEGHVKKILSFNKKLHEEKLTELEKQKLEEEIKKTDNEIDELVYELYGINEEEKKIIEESLK